jgi:hypothetical protein
MTLQGKTLSFRVPPPGIRPAAPPNKRESSYQLFETLEEWNDYLER